MRIKSTEVESMSLNHITVLPHTATADGSEKCDCYQSHTFHDLYHTHKIVVAKIAQQFGLCTTETNLPSIGLKNGAGADS